MQYKPSNVNIILIWCGILQKCWNTLKVEKESDKLTMVNKSWLADKGHPLPQHYIKMSAGMLKQTRHQFMVFQNIALFAAHPLLRQDNQHFYNLHTTEKTIKLACCSKTGGWAWVGQLKCKYSWSHPRCSRYKNALTHRWYYRKHGWQLWLQFMATPLFLP